MIACVQNEDKGRVYPSATSPCILHFHPVVLHSSSSLLLLRLPLQKYILGYPALFTAFQLTHKRYRPCGKKSFRSLTLHTHTHTHKHKVNTTQQARGNLQVGQARQKPNLSRKRPNELIAVKAPAIQSMHGNQKVVKARQQHPHTKRTCVTASVQNEDKGRVYPSSTPPCILQFHPVFFTPPPLSYFYASPSRSTSLDIQHSLRPSAHTQKVQTMRQEILPFFDTTHTHTHTQSEHHAASTGQLTSRSDASASKAQSEGCH